MTDWQLVEDGESAVYWWESPPDIAEYFGEVLGVQVNLTDEGIIMDAYEDGELVGTFAVMHDELHEWLKGR